MPEPAQQRGLPESAGAPRCRVRGGGGGGGDGPTVPPLPVPRLDTDLSAALSSGRASPTYAGLFGFGGVVDA